MTVAYACDCMCVNFKDKILLKGEECENPGKFKLFQKVKGTESGGLSLLYRLKT